MTGPGMIADNAITISDSDSKMPDIVEILLTALMLDEQENVTWYVVFVLLMLINCTNLCTSPILAPKIKEEVIDLNLSSLISSLNSSTFPATYVVSVHVTSILLY
jgi:hypothetical protein